jgi:hypothetical protein
MAWRVGWRGWENLNAKSMKFMRESMQKRGRTATLLSGRIGSPESRACRKSLARPHLRAIRQEKSNLICHILAKPNLPDTPTTATRRAMEIVKGEERIVK